MTDILRRRPKEAKKKRQKSKIVGILCYNKRIFGQGRSKSTKHFKVSVYSEKHIEENQHYSMCLTNSVKNQYPFIYFF